MPRKKARPISPDAKICGYVRKSDVRFPQECVSLQERQEFVEHLRRIRVLELTEDARRDGVEIDVFYDDMDISGRGEFYEKRVGFNQMRDDALHGKIKRIYARDLSRLFRNLMQQEIFFAEMEEAGVEVRVQGLPPSNDSHSIAMRQMFGAFNQWRATNDGETIRRNNRAAVDKKHWVGRTKSIWGLAYNKQTKHFDYDPTTAPWIVRLCELFVAHRGNAHGLCVELNTRLLSGDPEAFYTPTGLYWYPKVVLQLVGNLSYRRQTRYHDLLLDLPDHIPEVVPPELIQEVDFWLAERKRRNPPETGHPPGRTVKYTYTGILWCAHCGSSYKPRRGRMGDRTVYVAWSCRSAHMTRALCPDSAAFSHRRLEALVGEGLRLALEAYGAARFAASAHKASRKMTRKPASDKNTIERALGLIETKRRRFHELYAAGVIKALEDLKPHLDQLAAEEAALRAQIDALEATPQPLAVFDLTVKQWEAIVRNVDLLWTAGEPEDIDWEKYDLLHRLGVKLTVRAIPQQTAKGIGRQRLIALHMEISSLGFVGEHMIYVAETPESLREFNRDRGTKGAAGRWSGAPAKWPKRARR